MLALSLFFFCHVHSFFSCHLQLNWSQEAKYDNQLFLQKLRILCLPHVQQLRASPTFSTDSSLVDTLVHNSISFFSVASLPWFHS